MENLKGRTALVTGAARRIGRQIALALADAGANVVIHYRRSLAEAETLRCELAARGVTGWLVSADLERHEESGRLVADAVDAAGSLDFLVNSASLFQAGTVREMDFAGLMRHMQVNAWAPFVLSREFARRAGRGKIVNLLDSRIGGHDLSHVAYILSKHVLAEMTEIMALEFAPGFTVNGVAPGLILPPAGEDEGYMDVLAKTLPLERHGSSSDIAEAVLYLLRSDFVTGQVVYVDGGRHLKEYGLGPNRDQ